MGAEASVRGVSVIDWGDGKISRNLDFDDSANTESEGRDSRLLRILEA
jgi:hypothetical protein